MRPYDPDNSDFNVNRDIDRAGVPLDERTDVGTDGLMTISDASAGDNMGFMADTDPQGSDYSYNSSLAVADTTGVSGGTSGSLFGDAGDNDATDAGYPAFGATIASDSDTSGSDTSDDITDETEAIKADIEQTRTSMSATIDAIQEKLNPQTLVDQAKDAVREATIGRVETMVSDVRDQAREASSGLIGTIRENPLPAALAAIGIGWLYMKNKSNSNQHPYSYNNYGNYDRNKGFSNYEQNARYGGQGMYGNQGYGGQGYVGQGMYGSQGMYQGQYGNQGQQGGPGEVLGQVKDKAGDVVGSVGDVAGNVAGTVGDVAGNVAGTVGDVAGNVAGAVGSTVGNVAGTVGSAVGGLGSGVQQGASTAQNQLQRMLYENPLAVGGAAVILGAAIGMLLPETQQEHKMLGQARDTVMEKAQSVAQDTMDKVSQVADQVSSTVQDQTQQAGFTS